MVGTKRCPKCEEMLSLNDFGDNVRYGDGKQSYCRECMRQAWRKSRKKHGDKWSRKGKHLRRARTYGVTPKDMESLRTKQNNQCGICEIALIGKDSHVDHCHLTGRIRGLLCSMCNQGLGRFNDDPALVRSALNYLDGEIDE